MLVYIRVYEFNISSYHTKGPFQRQQASVSFKHNTSVLLYFSGPSGSLMQVLRIELHLFIIPHVLNQEETAIFM
jgi:hypothetical protein